MYPAAWQWCGAPVVSHTPYYVTCLRTLCPLLTQVPQGTRWNEGLRVGISERVFTYFTEIMKLSTICWRNSSWMVIGSYVGVVLLLFIPVLVLGLLYLLLRRAVLSLPDLTRSSVWARVLISAVAGWLVGAVLCCCCDGPLRCAVDRCGCSFSSCARISDAVIPIV